MSTETQKVDVLHVMREASAILIRDGYEAIPDDLLRAHDIVAEAIRGLNQIAACVPRRVININAKVGSFDAIGWDCQMVAKAALACVGGAS